VIDIGKSQSLTLINWRKSDELFIVTEAKTFLKDLPDAELHLIDSDRFTPETYNHVLSLSSVAAFA
jgi:hypothetical protein